MLDHLLAAIGPALLTLGAFVGLSSLFRPGASAVRATAAALSAALTLRYVGWRLGTLPDKQSLLQDAWVMIFLGTELLSKTSHLLSMFFMSRHIDRSAQADAASGSLLLNAPVDVFICTYNEPISVLERTIVGALDIDHPDLRVWVLDDGARERVRRLAAEMGALYVARVKGKHAKAGNINNGLQHALRTGRPPEFILLLDADFIANRRILKRTLGLFEETDVGIVQTPQHFFNPDPVQIGLVCNSVWPDEQRFFFNVLLPSKDAWGAAFCCGTSAVMRVEALKASGGFATETVTEDMLTSFKMREHGWRTIFLNERLSLGLAPEGLAEYLTQRGRWCLGAIQQLHTRWSCFGRAPIGLVNRISCLDGILFWSVSFVFRLMVMTAPALYWWTDTAVIRADMTDIAYWLLPSILSSILFMGIWGRGLNLPVISDMTQLLASHAVITNVIAGLVRPWDRPFKVTPKGISRDRVTVQWGVMLPFLGIAAATAVGLLINASPYSPLIATDGYSMNVFWSIFTIAVLGLTCVACIEVPRRRDEERFASGEPAQVVWLGRSTVPCHIRDISLGGAQLVSRHWNGAGDNGELVLDGGALRIPFQRLRLTGNDMTVRFVCTPALRHVLIGRLFGGQYGSEVEEIRAGRVLGTLVRRLVQ